MAAALEIQLGRLDLLNGGANRRHCLRVLPSSKGKKQKLLLGGEDGVVQCVSVKKGETVSVFKNPPGKREVTALALGGPIDAKDRIYAAYGQTIQGINKKKGAQFFLYSTVLNEDISSLYVEDLTIYTACEYSVNVFEANKNGDQVSDVHFYQSPDRIHHLAMTKLAGAGNAGAKEGSYNSVIACQDKHLRVIRDSDLFYEARVDGAVMEVQMYENALPPERKVEDDGTGLNANGASKQFKVTADYRQVIYGTDNGLVGQYFLGEKTMRPGFVLGQSSKKAGVTSIALCDVTLSGFDDVVVGRDDGTIEVFQYDVHNPTAEPVFVRELNESITTIEKGQVIANNSMDLLVSTYSGKVLTFTHELKHSNVAHIAPKVSNIKEGTSVASQWETRQHRARGRRERVVMVAFCSFDCSSSLSLSLSLFRCDHFHRSTRIDLQHRRLLHQHHAGVEGRPGEEHPRPEARAGEAHREGDQGEGEVLEQDFRGDDRRRAAVQAEIQLQTPPGRGLLSPDPRDRHSSGLHHPAIQHPGHASRRRRQPRDGLADGEGREERE
jgi:hypothetical protein